MSRRRSFLVGVDVGTTHIKAALVARDGSIRHVARQPTPTRVSPDGLADHPQDELVAAAEGVVAECVQRADGDDIAAIGIASFAEAGSLLDRRDQPIGELIAWFDPRSEREAAEVEAAFGASALFRTTGLRPVGKYSLPKLLWLRRHRPAVVRRAHSWVGVAELVALDMAGATGTNASLASRTLAFDIRARRWDGDLLAYAGLTAEQMPRVLPLGEPVGGLTRAAAARLGLPTGVPVVVAGHDHHVGGVGAGVVRPGMALDSMGSAEACLLITSEAAVDDSLRLAGFSVGCHAVDDQWYVIAALQASGTLVEWFIEHLLALPAGGDSARYAAFLALLGGAPSVPAAIVALPYLRGRTTPEPDPDARLTFLGIGDTDGLAELAAALVDGAACAVRWIFDELEFRTGIRVRRVRVIGGGARIERWRLAKAALSRAPLELVQAEEATALGAALVAGPAGGVFGSMQEAFGCSAAATPIDRPPSLQRRYEAYYRDRFLPAASPAETPELPQGRPAGARGPRGSG